MGIDHSCYRGWCWGSGVRAIPLRKSGASCSESRVVDGGSGVCLQESPIEAVAARCLRGRLEMRGR